MQINIPDKIHKFLLLISISLIGYSRYEMNKERNLFFSKIEKEYKMIDSFKISEINIEHSKEKLLENAEILSYNSNVKNPISLSDSSIVFSHFLGNKLVNDSVSKLVKGYKQEVLKQSIIKTKLKNTQNNIEYLKSKKELIISEFQYFFKLGIILFFLGITIWVLEILIDKDEKNELVTKLNERLYKYCQSCGQEFNSIITYGKNKNNSENLAFCKNCFENGEFKNLKITKEDVINENIQILKKKNKLHWWNIKLIKNRIDKLDRWKQ